MSTWVIISWVCVAILTGINVFVFLKLKQVLAPMLKMAFPGSKGMLDALRQAQSSMGARGAGGPQGGRGNDAQLKAAMEMLKKQQRGSKR